MTEISCVLAFYFDLTVLAIGVLALPVLLCSAICEGAKSKTERVDHDWCRDARESRDSNG